MIYNQKTSVMEANNTMLAASGKVSDIHIRTRVARFSLNKLLRIMWLNLVAYK